MRLLNFYLLSYYVLTTSSKARISEAEDLYEGSILTEHFLMDCSTAGINTTSHDPRQNIQ